jgi:hypothetical protein
MAVISIKNKTKSGSLLVGNVGYVPPSFESIETVTVGSGGAASISFTSIPQTYTHLQIRGIAKAVNNEQGYFLQINGDTASNYTSHLLYGDGSSALAFANNSWGGIDLASTSSSQFGPMVVDILDYTNTNKFKTVRSLGGVDNNGSGYINFFSGLWRNTNAVTSISIKEILGGGNITQFSSFALYGIKG